MSKDIEYLNDDINWIDLIDIIEHYLLKKHNVFFSSAYWSR